MNSSPKYQQQTKPKARQIIINSMIEDIRNNVIKADIELNFMKKLLQKYESGNIPMDEKAIKDKEYFETNLRIAQDQYDFNLEKLNFLKDLRETEKTVKMEKLIHNINNSTPETISISIEP